MRTRNPAIDLRIQGPLNDPAPQWDAPGHTVPRGAAGKVFMSAAEAANQLEEARRRRAAGAVDDAYHLAVEAFAALRRRYGPRSGALVSALLAVGVIEQDLGRLDAAEQAITRAMAIAVDVRAGVEVELDCRLALADLFWVQGRHAEAGDLLRAAVRQAAVLDRPTGATRRRLHTLLAHYVDHSGGPH